MRNLPILLTGLFAVACATPPFPGPDDSVLAPKDVAAAIAGADFVALGEEHMTPAVHRRHHELLRELYVKRPEMIIAMEMFERDVQVVLDQYLKERSTRRRSSRARGRGRTTRATTAR